jgi:hypothetical protein
MTGWLTGLNGRSDRTRELYRESVRSLREWLGEGFEAVTAAPFWLLAAAPMLAERLAMHWTYGVILCRLWASILVHQLY